jgi:hypothetical protein
MFIGLLAVTFLVALAVALIVARGFTPSLDRILRRIISDEISGGWLQYLRFAIIVVGVAKGVRIYELERYITPAQFDKDQRILSLTADRWTLEIYRTIIETLEGIAWLLLWFFVVALLAYVLIRIFELKRAKPE